jgi:hypothetical protein
VHDHAADAASIREGLKARKRPRSPLRLWTTDFAELSLADWYRGRRAFLVLSGPSLAKLDLSQLSRRGIVTMGVNNSWAVHRPTLWTCVDEPRRFLDVGWKDPGIVKVIPAEHARARLRVQLGEDRFRPSQFTVRDMPSVLLYRRSDFFDPARFVGQETVSWGCASRLTDSLGIKGKRSVMLAAVGLLQHLGFSEVYLVGADFRMDSEHRYAFSEWRSRDAIRHNRMLYEALERRFTSLRPAFERAGFRVLNATPDSSLLAFDRIDYDEAVERASAECGKPFTTEGWYQPRPKEAAR